MSMCFFVTLIHHCKISHAVHPNVFEQPVWGVFFTPCTGSIVVQGFK